MKILYVGKHDSGGNDDEGAVVYALEQLGHQVVRVREVSGESVARLTGDLLLFNKWLGMGTLQKLQGRMPRVFWYWDLVDWPTDPTLLNRSRERKQWMAAILPHVDLGFCTDGDWVSQDTTGKLVWLPQGFDERLLQVRSLVRPERTPILMTGIRRGGGRQRVSFVDEMKERYGADFRHIERGVYGERLATEIRSADIVVAPDSPVTASYWSNRIYLVLGLGGFLLHPYSEGLTKHYLDGQEVRYYTSRDHLHELIDFYRQESRAHERARIIEYSRGQTRQKHFYRHRCEVLLATIKERCP